MAEKTVKMPWRQRLKKIINSKLLVLAALLALAIGGVTTINRAVADGNSNTELSQVYQYFLLSNSSGTDGATASTDQSGTASGGDKSTKKLAGLLGNGGNQGTFSYKQIIDNADNSEAAKRFSALMATLSGYNYISVQSNGVEKILSIAGRGIFGLILLLVGVVMDLFNLFWNMIIKVIAEYNVFTMLANAWVSTNSGQKMLNAIGWSTADLKKIVSFLMGVFTVVIIWTFVMMLRRGADNLDQSAKKKLFGRLVGLIGVPVILIFVCMALQDVEEISKQQLNGTSDYADWMMDVQDWAYQSNFNVNKTVQIKAKSDGDGTYVDTSFNPYKADHPASKIGQSLYKIGLGASKSNFPNSVIAISYMRSETFDSRSYLGAIASSGNLTKMVNGTGKTGFGSDKNLYEFDQKTTSRGNTDADLADVGGNPMGKAKTDYAEYTSIKKNFKKARAGRMTTWEDRYIYGAKNTGALSAYYKDQPSGEQIYSDAGGGENQLSYESTFLALNTKFNDLGGTFSLDGPTYGAYATIAKYDSNRYAYYKYSMVGNPIFTYPAMVSSGIIKAMTGLLIIMALWSVGIVDMNVKPFRSWIKTISFGDVEYLMATLLRGVGVLGAIISITIVPDMINDLLQALNSVAASLFTGGTETTESSSILVSEMAGISSWLSFTFAIVGAVMIIKNVSGMRDKLIGFIVLPWQWADAKAQALEDQVSDKAIARGLDKAQKKLDQRRKRTNDMLSDLSNENTAFGKYANKFTKGKAGDLADKALETRLNTGDYAADAKGNGMQTGKEMTMEQLRRAGANRRLRQQLEKAKVSGKTPAQALQDFRNKAQKGLAEDNLLGKNGMLNAGNEYLSNQDAADVDKFNKDADAMQQKGQELQDLEDQALPTSNLTEDEARQLNDLENVAKDALGEDDWNEYQDLQKKLANGEALSPEEQAEWDRLNDKLGETMSPADLNDMQDLENRALSSLDGADANKLNDLEQRGQDILGEDNWNRYKDLQGKQAWGDDLTPEERAQFDNLNKQLVEGGLGADGVEQLNDLEQRQANGEDLTPAETKQLQRLTKQASNKLGVRSLNDYQKLAQKKASGQPMTQAEQQRLAGYDKQLKTSLGRSGVETMRRIQAKQAAGQALTPVEAKQLQTLQRQARQVLGKQGMDNYKQLQAKVNSWQKLTPEEQAQFDNLNKQLVEGGLGTDGVERLNDLEQRQANGEDLTPAETKQLQRLTKQASNKLGVRSLNDYQKLAQKKASGQPMTPAEQQRLAGYDKQLKTSLGRSGVETMRRIQAKQAAGQALTPVEAKQLQTLQRQARQVLGKQGMDTYKQLQAKVNSGQKLTPAEAQQLAGYKESLQGMGEKTVSQMQTLEAQRDSGLNATDAKQLVSLEGQAQQVLGGEGINKFRQLTTKQAMGDPMTQAEQKELMQMTQKLDRSNVMNPGATAQLTKLEGQRATGLNANDVRELGQLHTKVNGILSPKQVQLRQNLITKQANGVALNPAEKQALTVMQNRLQQTFDGAQYSNYSHLQGLQAKGATLTGEQKVQLKNFDQMAKQALGTKNASEFKHLQAEMAKGTPLSKAELTKLQNYQHDLTSGMSKAEFQDLSALEQKQATTMTVRDKSQLADFKQALQKQAGFTPQDVSQYVRLNEQNVRGQLSPQDAEQLKNMTTQIYKSMPAKDADLGQLLLNKQAQPVTAQEMAQFKELQALNAEALKTAPMSTTNREKLQSFKNQQRNILTNNMDAGQLARMQSLENTPSMLTNAQKTELERLRGQANAITAEHMSGSDFKEFKNLQKMQGVQMTPGQQKLYTQLQNRLKNNMTAQQQNRFNDLNQQIMSDQQRLANEKTRIVNAVHSTTHMQQAQADYVDNVKGSQERLKTARRLMMNFNSNGSEKAATQLLNNMALNVADTKPGSAEHAQYVQILRNMQEELKNYDFADRASSDTNGNGIPDGQEFGRWGGGRKHVDREVKDFHDQLEATTRYLNAIDSGDTKAANQWLNKMSQFSGNGKTGNPSKPGKLGK